MSVVLENKGILYDYAMKLVGLPYRWGGDDLIDGLDCSGLVIELLQSQGVLPGGYDASAKALFTELQRLGAQSHKPEFGVVSFFGSSVGTISHVSFCMSSSLMLEAGGGGSTTTSRELASEQNAYVRIRPIALRKDLLGSLFPKYSWR